MTQQIRLSQSIMTYGPGAILEGIEGPRVISRADYGLFYQGVRQLRPEDFEIPEMRITQGLINGARIFRLPTNAELGIAERDYVYRTKAFPTWKLCLNNRSHPPNGNTSVLYQGSDCPVCHGAAGRGRTEAIRFIRACPHGHMDDIDWNFVVHHHPHGQCDRQNWFIWNSRGGSLADIDIECPSCHAHINLGYAWNRPWPCSGRHPENENISGPDAAPIRPGCTQTSKIIQRQASNLRISNLMTLFSIPPQHTQLHALLQLPPIYSSLVGVPPQNEAEFRDILMRLQARSLIGQNKITEFLQYEWTDIVNAMQDINRDPPNTYHQLIADEFHALLRASREGVPPVAGPRPHSPVIFEVNPNLVDHAEAPNGTIFRITPVIRLRTVTVNRGYHRDIDTTVNSENVDIGFSDPANPHTRWYPGVEFLGEGIFITLEDNEGFQQPLDGPSSVEWMNAYHDPSRYPDTVFRNLATHDELNPSFVYWHTMSHTLIRTISNDAGYSSASIRERIYFESDAQSQTRGGILLYATQPGTEGTLGGMIALVPFFQDIFNNTFEQIQSCSGDPLCVEHTFKNGLYNGGACYSCLLVSETSCEHRNMWLDRNVILENMP